MTCDEEIKQMEHVSYNSHFKGKLNVKKNMNSKANSHPVIGLACFTYAVNTFLQNMVWSFHKRLTQNQSFQVSNGQEQGYV